jgi:hypothetical protein
MTDFNLFTINSKAYPATDPLVVRRGQRVRIRLGNLSAMDHHPIHLHGYQARVTETDAGIIPPEAQIAVNTVLVPVGSTRAIEFVADLAGDWVLHCHMTHHVMNQMGHNAPNLVGAQIPRDLEDRLTRLLPGYMTMGQTGMGEMAEHMTHGHMPTPPNSIPMVGAKGPFGVIDMGGMFTILKIREDLTTYDDPGWYAHPPGTVAEPATPEQLKRDGIDVS